MVRRINEVAPRGCLDDVSFHPPLLDLPLLRRDHSVVVVIQFETCSRRSYNDHIHYPRLPLTLGLFDTGSILPVSGTIVQVAQGVDNKTQEEVLADPKPIYNSKSRACVYNQMLFP